jgi:hypothetical protein
MNWEVSRENYLLDHRCIQMELAISQPPPAPVKNWQKTSWPLVTADLKLSSQAWTPPEWWTSAVLEEEVNKLSSEIYSAVCTHTPSFTPRHFLRKNRWWNEDLAACRKAVKKILP